MMEHKGSTEYEHLKDKMKRRGNWERDFDYVGDTANRLQLNLSDEEFEGFYELQRNEKDVKWMMQAMKNHNLSFTESLIAYITY